MTARRTATVLAPAAILAVVVLVGCGGSRIGMVTSEGVGRAGGTGTTIGTATATATRTDPTGPAPSAPGDIASATARLTADIRESRAAIATITAAVGAATDPSAVPALVDRVSAQLHAFDAAIASMQAYRVDDPALEDLRSRLVSTGVQASEVVRAFTESARQAADANDTHALTRSVVALSASLAAFLGEIPAGSEGG